MRCTRWVDGASCGRDDTALFPGGRFCPNHTPAVLAGRVVPTPDPAFTLAGLRVRSTSGFRGSLVGLGSATDDPLGRTVPPDPKAGMLPRYPCPGCSRPRPVDHKDDHV